MIWLVIGSNGSGKSVLAENLVHKIQSQEGQRGPLIYLATLVPADEDGHDRVTKHRRQRAGHGFLTIESPLAELPTLPVLARNSNVQQDGEVLAHIILVEDVSNIVANFTFAEHHPDPVSATLERIQDLRNRGTHLVVVTIGGLSPTSSFDESTNAYVNSLNEVNRRLRSLADHVIETKEAVT